MPLDADTRKTFPYVLIEDRLLPPEQQRTLVFRHVSARQFTALEEAFFAAFGLGGTAGSKTRSIDKILEGVRVALVGWRGFKADDGTDVPYDPMELDAVLELGDVIDLHRELRDMILGNEVDRKKAVLLSQSGSGGSAAGTTPPAGA